MSSYVILIFSCFNLKTLNTNELVVDRSSIFSDSWLLIGVVSSTSVSSACLIARALFL